jgi:phosphatidylglycerophosphate synthase
VNSEIICSIVFLTALVGLAAAYLVRVARRGRARHARSDADGGSVFVGKSVMEMGYWVFAPLARWLSRTGVSADALTFFALVPGLCAGLAVAFGRLGLACILGTVAGLCDLLDGLVARERQESSKAGELLDATVDRYVETFLIGGLAIHFRENVLPLALTLLVGLGSYMVSYGSARIQALGVRAPRGFMRRAERAIFILVPCGIAPFFSNWLMAGCGERWIREWPVVAGLAVVAAGSNLSAVYRSWRVWVDLNERHATDHGRAKSAGSTDSDAKSPRLSDSTGTRAGSRLCQKTTG